MRVSPFRDPRIKDYVHLPAAYRSLSRLSSAQSAKASAPRPSSLDHSFVRSPLRSDTQWIFCLLHVAFCPRQSTQGLPSSGLLSFLVLSLLSMFASGKTLIRTLPFRAWSSVLSDCLSFERLPSGFRSPLNVFLLLCVSCMFPCMSCKIVSYMRFSRCIPVFPVIGRFRPFIYTASSVLLSGISFRTPSLLHAFVFKVLAATCSPTPSPVQYHRPYAS